MLGFMLLSLLMTADVEMEKSKLIGTWQLVAIDTGKGPQPCTWDERHALTFARQGTGNINATNERVQFKFDWMVRQGQNQRKLDMVTEEYGGRALNCALYRVQGDSLTTCAGGSVPCNSGDDQAEATYKLADAQRPTTLKAYPKNIHVYVYKRVAP